MIMHGKNDFLEMLPPGDGLFNLLTPDGEIHPLEQADRVQETEPITFDFLEIPTVLLENMFSGDQMLDEMSPIAPPDLNYAVEEMYTVGNDYCVREDSTSSAAHANLIPTTVDFQIYDPDGDAITKKDSLDNYDDTMTTVTCDDLEASSEYGSISDVASEIIVSDISNPFSPGLSEHEAETRIPTKVKEELRYCIRTRRLTEGKEMPKVEFKEPEPEHLTEEEEERRRMRREKNKLAAQKCRNRKRETAEYLEEEIQKMELKNQAIRLNLKKLIKERDELRDRVSVHQEVCQRPLTSFINV